MARVHASAIVEDGAVLGTDVEIGPYAVVSAKVRLGDGVRIGPHVVLLGQTEIGAGTVVHAHAVLGGPAQLRSDSGQEALLKIGAGNVIREHVTISSGTARGRGVTEIGARGYFMSYSHVGHDCDVGEDVTFANSATLGGHVTVQDGVNIAGLAAVQQFGRIGRYAFIGGLTGVPDDVIPYGMVVGDRARLLGLNFVGLKRMGMPRPQIHALRAAYRFIFFGAGQLSDRAREAGERWPDMKEVGEVVAFILADAKRPICMPSRRREADGAQTEYD